MRVPFNVVDETIRVAERQDEPWTVQIEARASGRLDVERLQESVRAALRLHPLARAREVSGPWHLAWDLADHRDAGAVTVMDEAEAGDLDAIRGRLYSAPFAAHESAVRVWLVRHTAGDRLLVSVNHAAADGIASLRVLTSILRAYAGLPDPSPNVDPLAVRTLQAPFTVPTALERLCAVGALVREFGRPKDRLVCEGDPGADGYGFLHTSLGREATAALGRRRPRGTTINDVLVAGLHWTIAEWNRAHGSPANRLGVMVPINLRPRARRHELVGNFSSFASVVTTTADRRDLETMFAAVAAQTARIRADGAGQALIDLLSGPVAPPVWLRRVSVAVMRLGFESGLDTAVLSNLGRLEMPLSFGTLLGEPTELWFSPPACMPLGLAVGVVTTAGRLHLAVRYRRAVLGADGARRFAEAYTEALRQLS